MKQLNFKTGILSLFLSLVLVFINCQGDDDNLLSKDSITLEDAEIVADVDDVSEGISDLVEQLIIEEGMMGNRMEFTSFFPNCGTRIVKGDTAELMKTVTLDFGDGCTLPNGNIVKGKIIIVFNKNRDLLLHTISVTYENFYFNNKKVEGTTFVERLLANTNGNPQSTVKINLKITFADGFYIERKSERVREMVEGKDTMGFWGDNIFLITGNWTTVFKNGSVHKGEIMIPLRREMACKFIVSGTIKVQRDERYGTIDFGDGECDAFATFTNDNGDVKDIILGKR